KKYEENCLGLAFCLVYVVRISVNTVDIVCLHTFFPDLPPGWSTVQFECLNATDLILIHSNKLNYTEMKDGHLVRLTAGGAESAPNIKSIWLQLETQYLVIQLRSKLTPGQKYQLYSEFTGELADDLAGFYRSEYEEDGARKIIATSQMHPTHARKTFPCFDEPAMKAVFHITLLHPPGTIALSNGMETGSAAITIDGQALLQTRFEATKKMSTYLLAIIVSDYAHLNTTQGNIQIRIWARRKTIEQGQGNYALNVTGPILDFFQSYNDISYPLRKSDQIALPDFYFGAMENWGLVTYRETNLLYDPETSSNSDKETTATIIAHELAHMKDLIVLDDVQKVFAVDALPSSHPLTSEEDSITLPGQIMEQFDTISYSKAVKDNNMALPDQVDAIMNPWVLQMGFPVVTIDTSTGKVSQKHFLLDPESNVTVQSAYSLDVISPLCRAQMVPTSLALRTTSYLSQETEYMPWQSALNNLHYFDLMLDQTEVYQPMQASGSSGAQTKLKMVAHISQVSERHVKPHHDPETRRHLCHHSRGQYGVGSFSFASLISGVTARFSTPAELQQVCDCDFTSKYAELKSNLLFQLIYGESWSLG
ncbi:hypothetical protein XENOCAPTIV_003863, partial [Xenoophorus captivus]